MTEIHSIWPSERRRKESQRGEYIFLGGQCEIREPDVIAAWLPWSVKKSTKDAVAGVMPWKMFDCVINYFYPYTSYLKPLQTWLSRAQCKAHNVFEEDWVSRTALKKPDKTDVFVSEDILRIWCALISWVESVRWNRNPKTNVWLKTAPCILVYSTVIYLPAL